MAAAAASHGGGGGHGHDADIDLDALAALLEEEGFGDDDGVGAVGVALGVDPSVEGEPVLEMDADGGAPAAKGVGRFAPPRKAAGAGAGAPVPRRATTSSSGSSGWTPGYMRGTASRSGTTGSTTGSTSGTSGSGRSPVASSGYGQRRPSPAPPGGAGGSHGTTGGTGSGTGGRSPAGAPAAAETLIAGKKAFSSLPENAARAELVKTVEATITEAVGAGRVVMDDVIGLDDAKRALEEAITFPRVMASMGMPAAFTKGVLLYGPPGTGKTQLARAQATSAGCTFFAVTASSIMSKWLGESEKLVRALFDAARYYAPSIVFIDEVDALTGERGGGGEHEAMLRVKNELLAQLDGMSSGAPDPDKMVLSLGATNRPWALDEAFRRRFEKRILIPLPDSPMREALLRRSMRASAVDADVNYPGIAARTLDYNCADIVQVCRDAIVGPLRELAARMKSEGVPVSQMLTYVTEKGIKPNTVAQRHFDDALRRIKSSSGGKDASARLDAWAAEFGST